MEVFDLLRYAQANPTGGSTWQNLPRYKNFIGFFEVLEILHVFRPSGGSTWDFNYPINLAQVCKNYLAEFAATNTALIRLPQLILMPLL